MISEQIPISKKVVVTWDCHVISNAEAIEANLDDSLIKKLKNGKDSALIQETGMDESWKQERRQCDNGYRHDI